MAFAGQMAIEHGFDLRVTGGHLLNQLLIATVRDQDDGWRCIPRGGPWRRGQADIFGPDGAFRFRTGNRFLLPPRVSDHDLEAAGDVEIDIDRFDVHFALGLNASEY